MKVYIDNNILISYEQKGISLPRHDSIQYYYSTAHINELIESKDKLKDRLSKRLATIAELTNNRIIVNDYSQSPVCLCEEVLEPEIEFNKAINLPKLTEAIGKRHQQFDDLSSRNILIESLGIDKRRLNNYPAEEVLKEYGTIIAHYIMTSSSRFLMEGFQSCFNILELLGFWADGKSSANNRSYDALHAYFSTYCDYFITNDKRTLNKSKVAFKYFGINTLALSLQEFRDLAIVN